MDPETGWPEFKICSFLDIRGKKGKREGEAGEGGGIFLARMTRMDTVTDCHFSRNRVLDFLRPAVRPAQAGGFGFAWARG